MSGNLIRMEYRITTPPHDSDLEYDSDGSTVASSMLPIFASGGGGKKKPKKKGKGTEPAPKKITSSGGPKTTSGVRGDFYRQGWKL